MLPLLLVTLAARADCMGTAPFAAFSAVSPHDPVVFYFPDFADAPAPHFTARDQGGQAIPLQAEALPGVAGGLPVWRLRLDTDPATTRSAQIDIIAVEGAAPQPLATLQLSQKQGAAAEHPAPKIRGARWSRYAWLCSHEDALWLGLSAAGEVLAWELTLPSGEVLFVPTSPLRFFSRGPEAGDEVGLGDINCMLDETLSWDGQPLGAWPITVRAWYADGVPSAPTAGTVSVRALQAGE